MKLRSTLLVPLGMAALFLAGTAPSGSHAADEGPFGRGVFASFCDWSHSAYDDPIVHPGHPNASHRHDFLGNRATNAHSTARSLRRGTSNCSIRADRAAYWTPSLYKESEVVRPTGVTAWYFKSGAGRRLRPFPRGLKVVAGDATAERPQSADVINWSCAHESAARSATGRPGAAARLPQCARRGIQLRITFPSCWDGQRRDSRDHTRHMAYRVWNQETVSTRCPRSHPTPVPELVLDVEYPIRNGRGVTLASGHVRTAHADFFNGWRQRELTRLTRRCLARSRPCGSGQRY